MENMMNSKKGQVTIFIILAILIVGAIIIAFMLIGGEPETETPLDVQNPKKFIKSCVRDVLEPALITIMQNGGRIEPSHYITYQNAQYNYLCYQGDFYLACYNTHPILEKIVEEELRKETVGDIGKCFESMKLQFEDKGFSVSSGNLNYSIDLVPGLVKIKLSKKLEINKDGAGQSFENFNTGISSSLYKLIRVSREIVNSESRYCNVETNGYMILYPQYDLRRIDYDDSKIYSVRDRESEEEFRFAVRSCAFAPGI